MDVIYVDIDPELLCLVEIGPEGAAFTGAFDEGDVAFDEEDFAFDE